MDWRRHQRLAWVFVVALGCSGGDDDSTGEGTAQSVGETGGSASSTASGSEASTVDDASASMGTTIATSSEGSTTNGSSTTDTSQETSADTGGGPCGDAVCEPNELCINPCCGGEPPPCYPANQDGSCNPGDAMVDPGQCDLGGGCDQAPCCQASPCVPSPPFCMDATGLRCDGDQCNLADCFGYLMDGDLFCTCA